MLVSKAARRYATALLELAKEQDILDRVLEDILLIKGTIDESRDLLVFLRSPVINPDKKVAALDAIFEGKVSELVHKYITLIARKNRQNMLDQIVAAFVEKYNEHAGIILAEVFVAKKLDDKQLADVKQKLEEVTGKTVKISTIVQEDLRGGMAVKIDDTVINSTVKYKLEQLEDVFLSAAAG